DKGRGEPGWHSPLQSCVLSSALSDVLSRWWRGTRVVADRDWGNARATRVAVLAVITATVCWIAVMSEAPESPSSECWETVVPNLVLEVASANTIVSSLRLLVGCGALSEDAHARLRTLVAHRDPRVRAAVALTYAGQWSNDADATDALS